MQDKSIMESAETARLTDELIHANTQDSFAGADKFYNRTAQERVFSVGDIAYLYSEHVPAGTLRKLHCFYRPVEIVECLPNSCYRVKDNTYGRILPFKIHVTTLKIKPSETSAERKSETTPTELAQSITVSTQKQQLVQPNSNPSPTWHAITGILRRRRNPSGEYEYLVEWQADKSTSWLKAKDIAPEVVRSYNSRPMRRRRQQDNVRTNTESVQCCMFI